MKITVEGTAKEIADLVSELQGQPREIQKSVDLYPNPTAIHREAIEAVSPVATMEEAIKSALSENTHDTSEEKPC